MDFGDYTYPACVGLVTIDNQRHELWNDMVWRKYPLHLRLVPSKYITWDRNGAKLKRPLCLKQFF